LPDIVSDLLLDSLRCYVLQLELPDDVDFVVDADPNRRRPARMRGSAAFIGRKAIVKCITASGLFHTPTLLPFSRG
jgi:hypothetical protein